MADESPYWSKFWARRVSRRRLLTGTALAGSGLAAAAVVAHRLGKLVANLDPEDVPAISALSAPNANLVAQARSALARIKKQSELADLWDEAGDKDVWLATVDKIEQVL